MYEDLFSLIRSHFGSDKFIPLHEPRFAAVDKEYVLDAINSTYVSSTGEYVDRFERELAEYIGVKRVVAVVNGTCALQVALQLAGVQQGDEVLTQALTFVATANAIAHNHADPIFLDVDKDTMGLSPNAVSQFLNNMAEQRDGKVYNKKSGKRIAAIVPMHTFGHPCKISALSSIANEWGIPLVEDAAEAIGSKYEGQHCGTFGQMGVFSFNGNKTITCGGGGAIVTNDEDVADRAKHLTTTAKVAHKWEFVHDEVGYNYRMPNLNAALACAQLEQLERMLAEKRDLANRYRNFFSDVEWAGFVDEPEGCESNFWLTAIIMNDPACRDDFLEKTNNENVMARPAWHLLNELELYSQCQCDSLENSHWLQQRLVNLPSSAKRHE